MNIICHRCGDVITAPYFHEGKPYGYSCIKIVNPTVKKNKHKEHWVIADSHNYNPASGKHLVTATSGTIKRKSYVVTDLRTNTLVALDAQHMRITDSGVLINLL